MSRLPEDSYNTDSRTCPWHRFTPFLHMKLHRISSSPKRIRRIRLRFRCELSCGYPGILQSLDSPDRLQNLFSIISQQSHECNTLIDHLQTFSRTPIPRADRPLEGLTLNNCAVLKNTCLKEASPSTSQTPRSGTEKEDRTKRQILLCISLFSPALPDLSAPPRTGRNGAVPCGDSDGCG